MNNDTNVVFLITFNGVDKSQNSEELKQNLIEIINPGAKVLTFNIKFPDFLYDIQYLQMKRKLQPNNGIKIVVYLHLEATINCPQVTAVFHSLNYLQIPFDSTNIGMIILQGQQNSPFERPRFTQKSPDIFDCIDQAHTKMKCRYHDCRGLNILRKTSRGAYTNLRILEILEGQLVKTLKKTFDTFVNGKLKFRDLSPGDVKLFQPTTWTKVNRFYDHYYVLKDAELEAQFLPYMYNFPNVLSVLTLPVMFEVYGVALRFFPKYRGNKFNHISVNLRGWQWLLAEKRELLGNLMLEYRMIALLSKLNTRTDKPSMKIRRSVYKWLDASEIGANEDDAHDFLINLFWFQIHISLQEKVVVWEKRFHQLTIDPILDFLEQFTHDLVSATIERVLNHVAGQFPYDYHPLMGVETNFKDYYQNLTKWMGKAPQITNIYYSWPAFKAWTKDYSVPRKLSGPGDAMERVLNLMPEYAHASFQIYYHCPRFLRKISRIFTNFKVNATSKVVRHLAKGTLDRVDQIVAPLNNQLQAGIQKLHLEMDRDQWLVFRNQTFYQLLHLQDVPQPIERFQKSVKLFFDIHDIPMSVVDYARLKAVNVEFVRIQEVVTKFSDRPIETDQIWGRQLAGTREYFFRNVGVSFKHQNVWLLVFCCFVLFVILHCKKVITPLM